MNKTELETFIKNQCAVSSKQIIKHFTDLGERADAVRKAISRLHSPYMRLKYIRLANNAQILYHKDNWFTIDFYEAVVEIFREENSIYGAVLEAIKARGGYVFEKYFPILSGTGEQKKHIWPSHIKDNLVISKLLIEDNIENFGKILYLPERHTDNIAAHVRADCIQEQIMLQIIEDWLKKLNFITYNQICHKNLDNDLPKFATTYWDLTSPSYLLPLMKNNKQGSVICDLFLKEISDVSQVQYILKKLELLSVQKNISRYLPIIISPNFSQDVFKVLKGRGIIPATFSNLFGKETADLFRELYISLQNLTAAITKDPKKQYTIFEKIASFEGIANQIRGPLFEMICVHLVNNIRKGFIENGKSIFCNQLGKSLEIDIINESPTEIFIVECKGYLPQNLVSHKEVKKWLDTITHIRRSFISANEERNNKKFIFNFWTSSDFDKDAIELFSKRHNNLLEIHWKNGEEIMQKLKEYKLTGALKMLNDYFLKNFLDKQLS